MSKAKAITTHVIENTTTQRILFKVLMALILGLSLVYIYLIGSITFNIVARKSVESQVHVLSSRVSDLELTYLNTANKIDKNYALAVGFVEVHDNIFATRQASSRVAVR